MLNFDSKLELFKVWDITVIFIPNDIKSWVITTDIIEQFSYGIGVLLLCF